MDGSLHIYIIITSIVIYVVIIFLLRVLLLLLYDDYYYEYYRFSRRKAPIIIGLRSSIPFSPQPFLPLPFILLTLSLSTAGFIGYIRSAAYIHSSFHDTKRHKDRVKEGRLTAGFRPLTQTTIETERERQREGGLPTSHLGLLLFLFLNSIFSSFPPPRLLLRLLVHPPLILALTSIPIRSPVVRLSLISPCPAAPRTPLFSKLVVLLYSLAAWR